LTPKIDINCDLGESYGRFKVGHDREVMPYITSANIACGFHAGDPMVMAQTVNLAKQHGVAVGAHPGYPDLMGFGRRAIGLTTREVKNYIIYQVGALQAFARVAGVDLQHIKPHGALYNMAAKDEDLSEAIIEAIDSIDPKVILLALSNSITAKMAAEAGLRVAREVFADRAYNPDGSLVSRKNPGAVIEDPKVVTQRAVKMIMEGTGVAVNGKVVKFGEVHTICVHGDTFTAVKLARSLRKGLMDSGIEVRSAGTFV
jgi:UPF0271 protein